MQPVTQAATSIATPKQQPVVKKPAAPKTKPKSDLPGGVFTRRFVVSDDGYCREEKNL